MPSLTLMAVILNTDKRWASLAFTQGIAKASISLSFITFNDAAVVRGPPKMIGIQATK